jgi:hypothetical protein
LRQLKIAIEKSRSQESEARSQNIRLKPEIRSQNEKKAKSVNVAPALYSGSWLLTSGFCSLLSVQYTVSKGIVLYSHA